MARREGTAYGKPGVGEIRNRRIFWSPPTPPPPGAGALDGAVRSPTPSETNRPARGRGASAGWESG